MTEIRELDIVVEYIIQQGITLISNASRTQFNTPRFGRSGLTVFIFRSQLFVGSRDVIVGNYKENQLSVCDPGWVKIVDRHIRRLKGRKQPLKDGISWW